MATLPEIRPKPVFGTFHKTGTTLIDQILRAHERKSGRKVWRMHDGPVPLRGWDIGFHYHSAFLRDDSLIDEPYRCAILVRDPRDVVVSSVRYHLDSKESWLHDKSPKYEGLSYQEFLNRLPSPAARQVFEVEQIAGRVLGQMQAFDPTQDNILVVHLEDLMTDTDLGHFQRMFSHLGFRTREMVDLLRHALANSVFAEKFKRPKHMRSGEVRQWESELTPEALKRLDELYPGIVERLGYQR